MCGRVRCLRSIKALVTVFTHWVTFPFQLNELKPPTVIFPHKIMGVSVLNNHLISGLHSTEVKYLLLSQQPRVRFSGFPRIFLLMMQRFIDGTAEFSRSRLYDVNQTNLLLTRGKLVLQKNKLICSMLSDL